MLANIKRNRVLARTLVVMTILLFIPNLAIAEDRIALLIGNSRYEHITPLRNPENDVRLMAESLRRAGFEVWSETNLSMEAMKSAIEEFAVEAAAKPGAAVVLFYAGHGIQVDGHNYMLPVDMTPGSGEGAPDLKASAIDVDAVLKKLDGAPSRVQMIVLDACRNDPFPDKDRGARRVGLTPEETSRAGRLIAFSTAPGKTADDGSSGNSPYTGALAEVLLTPGLRIEDVFAKVRTKVLERTDKRQEPWETVALSDDPFYFFPPSPASEAVGENEELLWDLASVVATAESFQRYLDRHPNGRYAALARLRMDAYNRDDSFFRRNETFPIVTGVFEDTTVCRFDYPQGKSGIGEFRNVYELREQLVYVNFAIGLRELLCTRNSGSSLTLIPPEGTSCSTFKAELAPMELPKNIMPTECWAGETEGDGAEYFAADDWARSLRERGGGLWIQGGEGTSVVLPYMRSDYWSADLGIAEGHFEEAAITFSGFARIRERGAEDMVELFFDPVDPRDRGLTGRAENTKRRFSAGDRMAASDVKFISRPGNGLLPYRDWSAGQTEEPEVAGSASLLPAAFGVSIEQLENLPSNWEGYHMRLPADGQEYCTVTTNGDDAAAMFTTFGGLRIDLIETTGSYLIGALRSSQSPRVTVMVDESVEWTLNAVATAGSVQVTLGADWIRHIQGGNELIFESEDGDRSTITLSGSRLALKALLDCQQSLQ